MQLSVKPSVMCLHYSTFVIFICARVVTFLIKEILGRRVNFVMQNWKVFFVLELIAATFLDTSKALLLVIFNHMCTASRHKADKKQRNLSEYRPIGMLDN
jgi:hypothetical protein